MSIFDSISNALTSIKDKAVSVADDVKRYAIAEQKAISNAFFADPVTTKERRKEVFGTESKVVAGTAIVAASAVAIAAAPAAIGVAARSTIGNALVSAGSTVGKTIVSTAVSHPIATAAAVTVGAPVLAGVVVSNPKIVTQLPGEAYDTGTKLGKFIKENPKTAVVIGAAGLIGGAIAAAEIAGNDTNVKVIGDSRSAIPSTPIKDNAVIPSSDLQEVIPLTPPRQIIGSTTTTGIKKYKKRNTVKPQSQSVRVNIFNQSRLNNAKYIKN